MAGDWQGLDSDHILIPSLTCSFVPLIDCLSSLGHHFPVCNHGKARRLREGPWDSELRSAEILLQWRSQCGQTPDISHPLQLSATLLIALAAGPGSVWRLLQEVKYTGGNVPELGKRRGDSHLWD